MIETTGQLARITRSMIAGQPRGVDIVQVVSTDGDALTYTIDGVWFSTVTRSAWADWDIMPMPARVTFIAPGCSPITLTHDDMRELGVSDTVVLFGMTYKRTNQRQDLAMTYTPNHSSGYTVGDRKAVAGFQGEPDARVTVLGFHDDTTAIVRFDSADIGRDIARGEVHTVSTFYLVPRN